MTAISDQQLAVSVQPSAEHKERIQRGARDLINTSAEDAQSSINNFSTLEDLQVLRLASKMANRRKEITRAKILKSKIRKLEKALGQA